MVDPAERHRELVAHLATERAGLRRAKMMGVRGLTAADQAGLRGNELTMCFVASAPRFADRKHAFVDAAPDAAALVAALARDFSRVVQPRTRCRVVRQHFGGSRRPIAGPPIAECGELCPEPCFDKVGVGRRQSVLNGQAAKGPTGGLVGGLKGVKFGDKPIPQQRGLIRGQKRFRRASGWGSSSDTRRRGQAGSEGMAIRGSPIRPGQLIGASFDGEVRRIEVVLPRDPHQREQGVAPGIGQGGPHPMRRRGLAGRAHRPVG